MNQDNQVDETKLRSQADRGDEARRIIEHPLFKQAFEEIEAGILERFKNSKLDDEKTHRHALEAVQLLSNLRQGLEQHIMTGRHAQKQLLALKDPSVIKRVLNVV